MAVGTMETNFAAVPLFSYWPIASFRGEAAIRPLSEQKAEIFYRPGRAAQCLPQLARPLARR